MHGGPCADGMKIQEKEASKEQESVKRQKGKSLETEVLLLRLIGISIPAALILGTLLGIPHRFTIPYAVVAALVAGSIGLWTYANEDADSSEWWQDDDASGWRGY